MQSAKEGAGRKGEGERGAARGPGSCFRCKKWHLVASFLPSSLGRLNIKLWYGVEDRQGGALGAGAGAGAGGSWLESIFLSSFPGKIWLLRLSPPALGLYRDRLVGPRLREF